jgi:hypothetical protein
VDETAWFKRACPLSLNNLSMGRYLRSWGAHLPFCYGCCLKTPCYSPCGCGTAEGSAPPTNLSHVTLLMLALPLTLWHFAGVRSKLEEKGYAYTIDGLVIVTLIFFFLAVFVEPGILPTVTIRDNRVDPPSIRTLIRLPVTVVTPSSSANTLAFPPSSITTTTGEGENVNPTGSGPVRYAISENDGEEFVYFELIHFRAKFSRYTANCIENFDHFCPWIGNAVGRRNYRFFFLFVLCAIILTDLMAGITISIMIDESKKHENFWHAVEKQIATFILLVYSLFMFLALVGLFGFHIMAVAKNQTTNEIIKKVYLNKINPYDQGICKNCFTFCCEPIPPSRVVNIGPTVYRFLEGDVLEEERYTSSTIAAAAGTTAQNLLGSPTPLASSPSTLQKPLLGESTISTAV